jgi:hypothetical protein
MTLFTISLGIMELLAPYIFRAEHTVALQEALLCYFDMLSAFFQRKESMFGLVDKFVCFLHLVSFSKHSFNTKEGNTTF